MHNKPKIAMVILAAGESKRMPAIKQLLPWKNTTLLGNAIEQGLQSNVDAVYVVLGANSEKIKENITDFSIRIIENQHWKKGIGSSISCAVNYFKENKLNYNAILITLADQPLIDANHYNLLIQQYSTHNHKIITSNIHNMPSVPAIFDAFYFEELSKLNEDKGAKSIIQLFPNDVFMVNSTTNLVDVDTLETYNAIYFYFLNN